MERKLATVLFVDLVDSTGLVAGSDPEVVRRRVSQFFAQVSTCIESHGGTVEKFAGDAVMAAFGVPRAHEDDAERAVKAALAILDSLEGATVLHGRALPYGESITYWPLAEMVKNVAGIADNDPLEVAVEKLRECCPAEAVADLLGLATGVLEAVHGERSQQEIAWAAREWAQLMAQTQPLVMVFEDIHWAEEPLLELIEHIAEWVRDGPLLILCLARPELLDIRPDWGGGRVRATSIELESLTREDSELLLAALRDGAE